MGKRIFIVEPGPGFEIYKKYAGPFISLIEGTIDRIKAPDTEIVHKTCPPGFWKAPHTVIDYFMNSLAVPPLCKGAIEAEKEGADAIMILESDDPGLRFIRQLVDIPVVAEFETTVHFACMMGYKFGIISWPTRPFMARSEMKIRHYGLEAHAIPNPVEPVLEPGPKAEQILAMEGYTDPKGFVEKYYVPAAQKLIKRGAEVIICDSTGLSMIAENAGFSKLEDIGIPVKSKNASVPILNVLSIAIKMAEMRVDLHRSLGLPSVSRVGLYQKVDDLVKEDDIKEIRDCFENDWEPLPMPQFSKPK